MEIILGYIWPIAQIFLVVAAAIAVLIIAGIGKEYVNTKVNKDTTFAWNAVMNYVGVAVAAVTQIYQKKPDGMADTDWDSLRFQKANDFIVDFARSLGFTINAEFLNTIRGLIEGAVNSMKNKSLTSGNVSITSGTPLLKMSQQLAPPHVQRDVEPITYDR